MTKNKLTVIEAARHLGYKNRQSLDQARAQDFGPPFTKDASGHIYYEEADLDEWRRGHPRRGGRQSSTVSVEELLEGIDDDPRLTGEAPITPEDFIGEPGQAVFDLRDFEGEQDPPVMTPVDLDDGRPMLNSDAGAEWERPDLYEPLFDMANDLRKATQEAGGTIDITFHLTIQLAL
jgi:hypothetical protein